MDSRASILLDASPNKWVALSEDESRIVVQGDTFEEVSTAADEKGEPNAVLLLVPQDWSPRVFSACA
jgi:hypothetical protein